MIIRPQPGPQTQFLQTPVDVCIYGGSAGGGKSAAILIEPLRHIRNPNFKAVIFRRTSPEIRNPGGLWDESMKFYLPIGAKPTETTLEWEFKTGATLKFAHMQHEKDKHNWQGSQIPLICFDELTHFTYGMFTYMLSRNRSTSGVKPYIRATCNPDSESWVAEFISWWVDQDTGYAIPERSGVVRYFFLFQETIHWADTAQELIDQFQPLMPEDQVIPLSFTFIRSTLDDNKILLTLDPTYRAKLMAMPLVERERLLKGNWKISAGEGLLKSEWMRYYSVLPSVQYYVWTWDTAIKEGEENDFSAGQLWAVCQDGYYLVRRYRIKVTYPALRRLVWNSFQDQVSRAVLIEDKSSGQQLIQDFDKTPQEFTDPDKLIIPMPCIGMMPGKNMPQKKVERVNLVSPLFESGKIYLPDPSIPGNEWVKETVLEWVKFPNGVHDDEVDAMTQFLIWMLKNAQEGSILTAFSTGESLSDVTADTPIPYLYYG